MTRSSRRNVLLVVLVLTASAVAGGLFGGGLQADAQPTEERLRTFAHLLALVEDNFVGEADSEELVEAAIQGMLQTLDPHSNYLDPHTFTEMKDEQRGKFYGLGIQINKPGADKPLTIIAPIEDTPASRAGLVAGDVIYKIEGELTSELSLHEAVRRLKGDKGTPVTITVRRPSEGSSFDVTLMRDVIPTHSIRVSHMVSPGVGLIRISNFTSKTASELDEAVDELRAKGMDRLILDLRSNPGGLLDQAVQVSQRVLPPGKKIVETRGRVAGSDQDFETKKNGAPLELPLIVLVDRHSASASEIVAGAVQDHDRGLVVGERTFGKGLVQRVIPLRNGAAVALTTAKYYTPSGRLIQRDFTDLDDYFLDSRDEEDEQESGGPVELADEEIEQEVYYTDAGRVVYGGGGITPDVIVKSERASALMSRLIRQNMTFNFAVLYADSHPDLDKSVPLTDADLEQFRQFLTSKEFAYTDEDFETDRAAIRQQIRAHIAKVLWNEEEEARILAESDPQIQKALTMFDEARKLALAGERARAEKEALEQKAELRLSEELPQEARSGR